MNPLDQLKDIHLPTAVSSWPLSWAWWLLLAVAILIIGSAIYALRYYQKRNAITRLALKELQQLEQQHINIDILNQFLKRVALSSFPRQEVASLHGEQWYHWLDTQARFEPTSPNSFTYNLMQWQQNQYSAKATMVATPEQFATCKRWLKKTTLISMESQ